MQNKHTVAIGIATAATLCGTFTVGTVSASAHPAAKASGAATLHTHHTKLGTFLVDSKGAALYLFEKDKTSKSTCYGDCASDWPPLITKGAPVAGHGVKGSKLGTTKRKNGALQVTYNGHPLYGFAGDSKPGQTHGEGLDEHGAEWYVVNPQGDKIDNNDD